MDYGIDAEHVASVRRSLSLTAPSARRLAESGARASIGRRAERISPPMLNPTARRRRSATSPNARRSPRQQLGILQALPVGGDDRLALRRDRLDARARAQRNGVRGVPRARMYAGGRTGFPPQQHAPGKPRPLIRLMALIAEENDLARVAGRAQRFGGTTAGLSGAHDHDTLTRRCQRTRTDGCRRYAAPRICRHCGIVRSVARPTPPPSPRPRPANRRPRPPTPRAGPFDQCTSHFFLGSRTSWGRVSPGTKLEAAATRLALGARAGPRSHRARAGRHTSAPCQRGSRRAGRAHGHRHSRARGSAGSYG